MRLNKKSHPTMEDGFGIRHKGRLYSSAAAPEMISVSSVVICA